MATGAELYAASKLIAVECKNVNIAYLRCKKESVEPKHCLEKGANVKGCVDGLVGRLNGSCAEPYKKYQKCLYEAGYNFSKCRKTQKNFR
mmetsp:Transcript_9825/g.12114  ORF Transcript_9825/g.12114 Transcript_9825/m.12114 type:complete len:90 (+) Transcript_9825:90-359(+)